MTDRTKQYHIEGLRGLAIILVVLFHMNGKWFPMGYLGVDIFLVISGYLLFLRPILREGQSKPAAAWNFVRRKCGRLMWPLSVAVLISLAAGFFILVPGDMLSTLKTARCALFGFSNIYLSNLKDGGYFSPDASFNLMVPTWYVSLTCQVYLFFLACRLLIPKRWIKIAVPIGIVLSLLYANLEDVLTAWTSLTGNECHLFRAMPGYYSFGTRIWEVLAGGVIFVLPRIPSQKCSAALGVLSLAALLFLLFCPLEARGCATLLTVAATVLCIRYADAGLPHICLTNRVLLWFGKISFSIYLVHMAVVATMLCIFCNLGVVTLPVTFLIIVIVALVFYRMVESKRYPVYVPIAVWIVALLAAVLLAKAKPACNACVWSDINVSEIRFTDWQYPVDKHLYDNLDVSVLKENGTMVSKLAHSPKVVSDHLVMLGNSPKVEPSMVLFGDSHAAAFFYGLDAFCRRNGLSGIYLTPYIYPLDCWEISGTEFVWSQQQEVALMRWLEAHPEIKTVFLCQRWHMRWTTLQYAKYHSLCGDGIADSMRKFITRMKEMGKNVIVTTCVPDIPTRNPLRSYRYAKRFGALAHMEDLRFPKSDYDAQMQPCNDFLQQLENEGLCRVLHIEKALFPKGLFDIFQNGYLLMDDTSHLSPYGAETISTACDSDLLELLKAPGN